MRRLRYFLTTLSLLFSLCLPVLSQQSIQAKTHTRFIDVGGYKLRLQVSGVGSPTVVFDSGLGDSLEPWSEVFSEIARFTRVVAYDRAGLGKSDPGPTPRSFTQIATELHTLLRAAEIPPHQEPEGDEDPFQQAFERLAPTMPAEAEACAMLDALFPAAIAMFSASPEARRRGAFLQSDLDVIAIRPVKASWIARILKVLHEEPYVAIDPASRSGIAGKMSGIVENFQLNVLLMDIFPQSGWFSRRRVSAAAAQIARGLGPQTSEEILTGAWNLYTWRALQPDKTLPSAKEMKSHDHWIWNEGIPADIDLFDGSRVILLGEPSYQRTWRSQRSFAGLPADLTIEQKLGAKEIEDWLKRMVSAK